MKIHLKYISLYIALFLLQASHSFAQYAPDTTELPEVVVGGNTESEVSELRADDRNPAGIRNIDQQEIEKLRKDDDFWYVNQLRKKEIKPVKENWLNKLLKTNWFEPLLWIIIIGSFIGILIWFLSTMDVSVFRKKAKQIREEGGEDIPENIFEIDFEKAIEAAVSNKDFRLAVRLMYLQLLKELSEKNIIRYNPQRPNSEYVMQLYGTGYYQDFFSITRNFEYAWYGDFHVSPGAYEKIRADVSGIKTRMA